MFVRMQGTSPDIEQFVRVRLLLASFVLILEYFGLFNFEEGFCLCRSIILHDFLFYQVSLLPN